MNLRFSCLTALLVAAQITSAQAEPAKAAQPAKPLTIERRRIVGILDVHLDGVPREIAAQFEANLEKKLDTHAYWLAPRARVHEMLANSTHWSDGCVVGACLKEVRTQTGADIVLLAAITGSGNTFGYVVTLVRTDNGQALSQATDHCDVCTVNEALSSATEAAVTLVTSVPEKLPDDAADREAALNRITDSDRAVLSVERFRSRAAEVLTVAGLAAAGVGFALYFAGDRRNYALATGSAGSGLALGAMIFLAF